MTRLWEWISATWLRAWVWVLAVIRRIDPDVASRISRGWGWHLIWLAAVLYSVLGVSVNTSVDNFVLFIGAVSGALPLMFHAHATFIRRPPVDAEEWRWVEYRFYRVLMMCVGVLAVGSFF